MNYVTIWKDYQHGIPRPPSSERNIACRRYVFSLKIISAPTSSWISIFWGGGIFLILMFILLKQIFCFVMNNCNKINLYCSETEQSPVSVVSPKDIGIISCWSDREAEDTGNIYPDKRILVRYWFREYVRFYIVNFIFNHTFFSHISYIH